MLTRYMHISFLFLLGCFFISNVAALGSQPFFKHSFLNLKTDLAEAAKAGRVLMVIYEQEGCVYCAEMHKINFADKETVDLLTKHRKPEHFLVLLSYLTTDGYLKYKSFQDWLRAEDPAHAALEPKKVGQR